MDAALLHPRAQFSAAHSATAQLADARLERDDAHRQNYPPAAIFGAEPLRGALIFENPGNLPYSMHVTRSLPHWSNAKATSGRGEGGNPDDFG